MLGVIIAIIVVDEKCSEHAGMVSSRFKHLTPCLRHVDDVPFIELFLVGKANPKYVLSYSKLYQKCAHHEAVADACEEAVLQSDRHIII